jgi:hypothetical protein
MVLMYFVKHYCSDTFGSNLAPVYIYQFKNYLHNKWQYTTSCKHNYLNRICSIYTGVGKEIRFEENEENR